MINKNSYLNLFLSFARVGLLTFGGGVAMLPMLQKECVEKNHWATDDEMLNYFAIGQCTPGIIAVNSATFIGFKVKKMTGAIVATFGIVFPSFLIISALAFALGTLKDNLYYIKAVQGIRIVVCSLIFNAIITMGKKNIKSVLTFIIALISLVLTAYVKLSPVYIVLLTALFALFYYFVMGKKDKTL